MKHLALFYFVTGLLVCAESVISPANKKITLDGFTDDWAQLDSPAIFEAERDGVMKLSHDLKYLLLTASQSSKTQQTINKEWLEISIQWRGAGNESPLWRVGVNEHGRIDGLHVSQIMAAVRHDLKTSRTTYECAIPLDRIPENVKETTISVRFIEDKKNHESAARWEELPIQINEFSAAQEAAAAELKAIDFKTLSPEQARALISDTIPTIGNTASGLRIFLRTLKSANYSDMDRAKAIAKFMHKFPDNPRISDLVLALFRTRLGKLGWDKSFRVVKAVSQSAKIPRSEVYDGLRGHYSSSREIIVKDWHVIGPFPGDDSSSYRRNNLPPALQKITLQESYTLDGTTLRWQPAIYTKNLETDVRRSLDTETHGKAYAVTWVHSAHKQKAAMEFFAESLTRLWINGRPNKVSLSSKDESIVQLNKGWNQLLVETDSVATGRNAKPGTWKFKMILLHPMSMGPVPTLRRFNQLNTLKVKAELSSSLPTVSGHEAEKINDGINSTFFFSKQNVKKDDDVTMTFTDSTPISRIRMTSGNPENGRDELKHGVLEYSIDGKTWITGASFTNGQAEVTFENPTPLMSIRIRITEDHKTWLALQDIQLK